MHCMEVFHYCAEVLKDVPLFESIPDSVVNKVKQFNSGAIYNDVSGCNESLMRESDFEDEELYEADSSNNEDVTELDLEEPIVTQNDIDEYFLQSDEADPNRWVKDHPLFSCHDDSLFKRKVDALMKLSNTDWDKLPIKASDIER